MSRKKTVVGNTRLSVKVAIAFFSILIVLVLTEFSLWISYPLYSNYYTEMWRYAKDMKILSNNPKIAIENRPSACEMLYGAEICTDKEGWRGGGHAIETSNKRIMILGDSITLGWGVNLNETFANVLEKKLNSGGIRKFEVINTGVGNYNTEMEVNSFLENGKKYRPDAVILMYYVNDVEQTPRRPAVFEYAVMRTYTYSFFMSRLTNIGIRNNKDRQYENYYSKLYADPSTGKKRAEEALITLAIYCRENNVSLAVAVIPEMHRFMDYKFSAATDFAKEFGEKNNVKVIDLLPYFENITPESLWISYEDAHPNAQAHKMIADALYENIPWDFDPGSW